jgi:hypothetical protein
VGFVVDKMALGQVFSEYFGFSSFHQLLHIHHHLSSGAGTIGQLVTDVPSGLSLTPLQEKKTKGPFRCKGITTEEETHRARLVCVSVSTRGECFSLYTAGLVLQFIAYRVSAILTATVLCGLVPQTGSSDLHAGSLYKEHIAKRLVLVFTESEDVSVQLRSLK